MSSSDSATPRDSVLLVGHCGPDAWMLRSMVQRTLPDARVEVINSQRELNAVADRSRVWLVNRVLDGHFDADGGLDLIERAFTSQRYGVVRQPDAASAADQPSDDGSDAAIALMLISDFPDAQRDAEQRGALPGFGKSAVNADRARERLLQAWGMVTESAARSS